MAFNDASVRKHLKAFAFTDLFVEDLGWDRVSVAFPVEIAGHTYALQSPVHKAGLHVFLCPPGPNGIIPDYTARRRIEHLVAKSFVEHLIIFTDAAKTAQVWQWMKREKDQPIRSREHTFHTGNPGPLVQKLQKLQFTLDEEEQGVSIVHSAGRTRDAFDVEKVTKKFYEQFRKEHGSFLEEIEGFPPPIPKKDGKKGEKEPHPDVQWYTSLTLNRLMFVYFIQKKRFLDGDPDYLQNRLKAVREKKGKDKFHSFYRLFLLHLFHDGLGKEKTEREKELDPALLKLIGNVPYLNGGFFEVHQLERDYLDIDIPDKAFQRLFAFFDTWDWVLDTRVPRDLSEQRDRKDEINPDVVGYIFEKYINQKQMGAYYTKEDITGYITQNTVIPFILDAAAKDCAVAFQPDGSAWKLLKEDPDRYIYEPVRRGVIDDKGKIIPLPSEIEAGISDIPKRAGWNKPAPSPFALPTETWREHVARRQRCLDLRGKLRKGEIHTVNDLITHNLDIRQFAQDIITNADGPELLRALWQPLKTVTILDPTCGSGAFLFAALQLLEPLYAGCLDKMQALLSEAERLNDFKRLARLDDFKKILDGIAKHANEDYFVLKSIIVNNLYGVDIMEEAVEICRLRLFLKLVSTVTEASQIEPLPDIDFNVRAGNTLVGYATKAQSQDNLNFGGAIDRIDEKAKVMDLNWQKFQAAQTEVGLGAAFVRSMKSAILTPLGQLREELDSLLAVAYGQAGKDKLPAFRKSHQPFHWWIEFYGIMKDGGFDVIVGNPPYVEYKDVAGQYSLRSYRTQQCSNLFAYVIERTIDFSHRSSRVGMIIPLSAFSTDRMVPLIAELDRAAKETHILNFSWRPGKLFDGVNLQLSIALIDRGERTQKVWTTQYLLWDSEARSTLFSKVEFAAMRDRRLNGSIPKLGSPIASTLLDKLRARRIELSSCLDKRGSDLVYYRRGGLYWKVFVDFETGSSEEKELHLKAGTSKYAVIAALSSNLWFWYFTATSDCRHLGNRDIDSFPFDPMSLSKGDLHALTDLGKKYVTDLKKHATRRVRVYKKVSEVAVLSFLVKRSKDIIDEIDAHIAKVMGLSAAELDFIQNFDIKYRLGDDDSDED